MEMQTKEMKKTKSSTTPLFSNIKFFVLCHGLLQLTQLLYSAYLKSSLTTIERRYGLSSFSSGMISSLHEVGNTVLIIFVSYMGSWVHRPRFIGMGGLLMALSAVLMTLPHFLSEPYTYSGLELGKLDMCEPGRNSTDSERCDEEGTRRLSESGNLMLLMASTQLLFGIGSVPIQPFGISYVYNFAEPGNSDLYIAILFAVSVFGPAFGYLLGSMVLRIYVDIDRTGPAEDLNPADPRWVGAWWMGLLISSGCLFLTSIPYFFFPKEMQRQTAAGPESSDLKTAQKTSNDSLIDFLKIFPRVFVRLLLSPFFLPLVLAQCCFSSVIAGLSTFLSKFLELQYSTTAAFGNLLIGAINLPAAALGMLLGGVVMKCRHLSMKAVLCFSSAVLLLSIFLCVPLFYMGCSTQDVAGVNVDYGSADRRGDNRSHPLCISNCSCPDTAFNPVCGSDNREYVSACHAGCTTYSLDPENPRKAQAYNGCLCIQDGDNVGSVRPGSCTNSCPHYLLPVMFLISLAGFIAGLSHNPIYMTVLRTAPEEEKSFTIGVQFLIMRVLAWLPAPAIFGMVIDSSCIWWKQTCGTKLGSCGYYDNNLLRNRYLGLQVALKVMGIFFLGIVSWKVRHVKDNSLEKNPEGLL
ncbi:solute carrier organic anion transporter family member 2A1-like [Brienomyrus brachyistius]|uniref:solute carrier organic anion transporter family member 2A1-like n=1 Tax=Brienomyrus brachyistius TaxID=42636 RepID=UPI0020B2548D|nr:solute carrier organic anion transporter family member 2A1-like [Brienomyrus brachyistius]